MANRAYLQGNYHWTNGDLSWLSDNIKVAGCSSSYTPNTAAGQDEFLSIIPGGAIVCTSGNLAGKTNVGGALDATDVTFTAVSGSTITQFVVYNDTGTAATSELIALYDTASGLPCVPNGGNITLIWAEAPNFVIAFYREDVSRKFMDRWKERIKRALGESAVDETPSGLWICGRPRIAMEWPCR